MRRFSLILPALVAAVLLAAGCGSSSSSSSSSGKDPASIAPRGAALYGSAVVRPTGSLKAAVESVGRKVLAGRELGPTLENLLTKALKKGNLDYGKDVRPWLGTHVAAFASSFTGTPTAAAIIETTSGSKALATVKKAATANHDTLKSASYRGTSYTIDIDHAGGKPASFAIVNGFLVAGTEAGVHAAIDASKGDALADSSEYKDATSKVSTDGLALFYIDTPRIIDAIGQANPSAAVLLGQLRGLPQFQKLKPVAAAITVRSNAIRFEIPGHPGSGAAADAITKLPADSWLALAIPSAGDAIRRQVAAISQLAGGDILNIAARQLKARTGLDLNRDLLSWIGGVSAYATGTSLLDLNVAVVIDSKDPTASRRAVAKLSALIERTAKVPVTKVAGGIAIHPHNFPAPIIFAAAGDKVVIAYGKNGVQRALHPQGTLGSSASYKAAEQALGGRPAFLLYVPSILQFAQGLGAGKSASFQKALPYLQAYSAIALGTAESGGHTVGRLAVGVK